MDVKLSFHAYHLGKVLLSGLSWSYVTVSLTFDYRLSMLLHQVVSPDQLVLQIYHLLTSEQTDVSDYFLKYHYHYYSSYYCKYIN